MKLINFLQTSVSLGRGISMSELELQNKTAQDVEDFIAIVKMHDNVNTI